MCIVRMIKGVGGLVPGCAYPAENRMKIEIHSERAVRARKTIVEILLCAFPDDCLYCVRNDHCELQGLTGEQIAFNQDTIIMTRSSKKLTQLAVLLAFTAVIQMIGLPQPVTGPLINAILIVSTLLIGVTSACTIGVLTPLTALIRGHLPPVLAAMVPFIALANTTYVLLFFFFIRGYPKAENLLLRPRPVLGILVASTAKFLILTLTVQQILPMVVGQAVPEKVMTLMMFPQLLTALAGGMIALILMKYLPRPSEG